MTFPQFPSHLSSKNKVAFSGWYESLRILNTTFRKIFLDFSTNTRVNIFFMFVYFINDINKHSLLMQIYAPFVITVFLTNKFNHIPRIKISINFRHSQIEWETKKKIKKQSSNNLRYELRNNSFLTSKIFIRCRKTV